MNRPAKVLTFSACAWLIFVVRSSSQIMAPILTGFPQIPLNGLIGRYEAGSTPGAQNAAVSSMVDTSGNGNNATQATSTLQPVINYQTVNGQKAVEFFGNGVAAYISNVETFLNIPVGLTTSSQSFSGIAIWETTNSFGSNNQAIFNVGSGAFAYLFWNPVIQEGNPNHTSTAYLPWGPQMIGVVSSASSVQTVLGNTMSASLGTMTSRTVAGGEIGAVNATGSDNVTGNLKALFFYNRAITQADVNQIYANAQWKYYVHPVNKNTVVFGFGDSLTAGFAASSYNGRGWMEQWLIAHPQFDAYNFALSGSLTSQLINPGTIIASTTATNKICTIQSGTNNNAVATSGAWITTSLSDISSFVTTLRGLGCTKIVTIDMLPRSGGVTNGSFEANRLTWNADLIANPGSIYGDSIVDVGADMSIGQAGDEANNAYYVIQTGSTTDGIHLNDPGNGLLLNGTAALASQL